MDKEGPHKNLSKHSVKNVSEMNNKNIDGLTLNCKYQKHVIYCHVE